MKSYNLKMNLQLFADPSASLQNTTGTMTNEMKTFYEKRLIDQAEPRLVHDQFADYYPVPQNGGKTIEFRKYDSLPKADTPLTEGVTPNGQTLNVTTITSDLHQYGGWTPLTDVLQMTAIDNNVVQATRVLASQAGRTMDSITRDVLAGGTNVIYAPKLSADGTETAVTSRKALDKSCTLTPKLFFQAAAQLGAMNADPIGDSYIAIIHPYAAYDLKTCKEFIEAHKYADPDTMYRGEIGKLGNIRFIETSEAKIWKDATCPEGLAVFGTLVLGAHAYGVTELEGGGLEHIVKQLGYGDDPLNQRASVGWNTASSRTSTPPPASLRQRLRPSKIRQRGPAETAEKAASAGPFWKKRKEAFYDGRRSDGTGRRAAPGQPCRGPHPAALAVRGGRDAAGEIFPAQQRRQPGGRGRGHCVGQRPAGRRRAAGAAALRQPVPALSVRHDRRRAGRERPVRR